MLDVTGKFLPPIPSTLLPDTSGRDRMRGLGSEISVIHYLLRQLAMTTTIRNLSVAALSAILVVALSGNGWSQATGYGAAQVSSFQGRNSSSHFSVSNIENRIKNRSVSNVGVPGVNRSNFLSTSSNALSRSSKPFASLNRGPAVSPYLALSAPRASASDYQSIIRPQQQAQRDNQRQQAFSIQRQRRLNQMAARAPFSTTGDEASAPTGHAAVFQSLGSYQNTGNYFPPPSRPKQR